jgi:hypothetical protein
MPVIETLKSLIALLSPASVTLKDIQPKLGSVVKSYPNNTHLKPQDSHFSHIDVVQQYQSDQVAHVDFALNEPIPLKDLQSAFGEYRTAVPDSGEPNQAIFMVKQPDLPADIAVIATLNRAETEATSITLRRDVHSGR